MKIKQQGIPPYIIMSAGSTEIEGHPGYRDNYIDALRLIFDLTNTGTEKPGP